MNHIRRLIFPIAFATVFALVAHAQVGSSGNPANPGNLVIGKWNLNIAKSKFVPGPTPQSERRTYENVPSGVKATIRTVYADGHMSYSETVADYDGAEHPVTGNPNVDVIKLNRVDDHTAETTAMHAGTIVSMARRLISEDGNTMTITYKGTLNSEPFNNVAVFDREK